MSQLDEDTTTDVEELLTHIVEINKGDIVICLERLQNNWMRCMEFAKNGGIQQLVYLIQWDHTTIRTMCMDILADICMSADAREQIQNSNIHNNVIPILENFELDSSVHYSACRLIGNLFGNINYTISLYKAGVVESLRVFLFRTLNMQNSMMGVRAVRKIWNIYEDSRQKILDLKIIQLVAQLFITARNNSDFDIRFTELVDACLRTMCAFLDTPNVCCGKQMEDEDKECYQCIQQCCNDGNEMAIKCLYRLCLIKECQIVLVQMDTIEQVIDLIIYNEYKVSIDMLGILFLFCRESCRNRVIFNDGLQVILTLLQNPELEKYYPILLHALTYFQYCDYSMKYLGTSDLVEILINELNKIVKKYYKPENLCYSSRHCDDTNQETGDWIYYHLGFITFSSLFEDSTSETNTDTDDNCSTISFDTNLTSHNADRENIDIDADSIFNLNIAEELNIKCSYSAILVLLYNLRYTSKCRNKLFDTTTIHMLLLFIHHTKNEIAIQILKNIIRQIKCKKYLMPLIKTGFLLYVNELKWSEMIGPIGWKSEIINHCCRMAQSEKIFFDICELLQWDRVEEHTYFTALSIPFLYGGPTPSIFMMTYFLINYEGLTHIFYLLAELEHPLHVWAILSIRQLAITLKIDCNTLPSLSNHQYNQQELCETNMNKSEAKDNNNCSLPTVTFELDDGTTVLACRRTLCQSSEIFRIMLEGNFSESGKQRVKLREVSRSVLNTFLNAIYGVIEKPDNIELLLDAAVMADMYLMPEVVMTLSESIAICLTTENIYHVWCWAIKNSHKPLKFYCIKKFLSFMKIISKSKTMQIFHSFCPPKEFLSIIWEILTDKLEKFQ